MSGSFGPCYGDAAFARNGDRCAVEVVMADKVFGPVRCIQFFAALKIMPDHVMIQTLRADQGVWVHIGFDGVEDAVALNRIFSKIAAMPSTISVSLGPYDMPGKAAATGHVP